MASAIRVGSFGVALVVALAWGGFIGSAGAQGQRPEALPYTSELPDLDPGYRRNDHKVVLIRDQDLLPRTLTLEEGQLVAWISYSKSPSVIVFERETARSMVCHSLVNFSIKDDELRSAEIMPGEFASFCQLKPGRYRYKIVRPSGTRTVAGSSNRIDGEIIVGNPS